MLISQNNVTLNDDHRTSSPGDLELFKMLLQPHFLFNSLNNLYALSIKQSDQTADAIAGLSDLLEKVVSSTRMDYIPLTQEVELIRDYIKLEKIWLGESGFLLDLEIKGDTDQIVVPPLLLYTFVENCFKHGVRKCAGEGWLSISIVSKRGTLYFSTKNQVPSWEAHEPASGNGRTGLGVVAARELLERKCCGKYRLESGLKNSVYSVDLRIDQLSRISA